jgi:hypothetical protein
MFHAIVIISAMIWVANFESAPPPLPDDTAEETQHAICKIITQEVQTSANATVKRQLKGVCTTRQIERKFVQLERKLLSELNSIKAMLTNERPISVKTTDYEYFSYDENLAEKSLGSAIDEDSIVSVTESVTRDSSWVRTEIDKLNNTVYTLKSEKVFTYYWEISQIRAIFRKQGIHIRSPDFYVLGHQLCLQLYPNHLHSDYLGIQLRPSSNFLKKHKFTILDRFDSNKDINSQTLNGVGTYEGVYRVPYAKLEERHYLHNDAVIIKVTIYLNS